MDEYQWEDPDSHWKFPLENHVLSDTVDKSVWEDIDLDGRPTRTFPKEEPIQKASSFWKGRHSQDSQRIFPIHRGGIGVSLPASLVLSAV